MSRWKLSAPDLLLGTDGTVYVNANSLNLAEHHGRRVMRVLALTPRESKGIAAMLTGVAPELLVGVVPRGKKRRRRAQAGAR